MLAVVSRLCGLHAQVMSSAELTLWNRVEGLDRRAVQSALWEQRTLVKTWAMRGTLHLLPADETPLWHAALATSSRYRSAALWRRFGLTLPELDRLTSAIASALEGRIVTREELVRDVVRITRSRTLGKTLALNSWGTILKPAAFTGRLCFGPSTGQRVRFTHPGTWLPSPAPPHDPETATASITRRFLSTYGPATHTDLARWWGGGGLTAARRWIAALGDEAAEVDLEGTRAWMLAADLRQLRDLPPIRSVRLLPAFDQYVIGASHHAAQLLPGDFRAKVYRQQGWISPVLLVNGRMHGVWRHEIKGSRLHVMIEPLARTPSWVRREAVGEARRLANWFERSLTIEWT
jgi:hypothetical protein